MSEKIELSDAAMRSYIKSLDKKIDSLEKEIEDLRYKLSHKKYAIEEIQKILRRMGHEVDG
jgi:prefoldin subunit 5